jgi:hypothetical protein
MTMKYLFALLAACVLMVGVAVAQQNPDNRNEQPSSQYPNAQQYPRNSDYGNLQGGVIPSGTQLQIRTNENITADKQSVGRTYSAEIADNVLGENGQVLIPRGSPATLVIERMGTQNLGTSNEVALGLQSVNIGGRTYNVQSSAVSQTGNKGIGLNKRTAEMTGGGALLGTVVGAIAGGGKGAAIGAAVGGAGGAATQVLTKGSQVKVPAETLMTFNLNQAITLR